MPIYEFTCPKCGLEFEDLIVGRQSLTVETAPCPRCGEISSKRISSPATVIYKGSGFTKQVKRDED